MKTPPRKENQPATGLGGHERESKDGRGTLISEPPPGQGMTVRGNPVSPAGCRVSPLKKITVLLVDDNAFLRQCLGALLATEGHTEVIGQARNGREAVKLAHALQPDVILMDIAMPVLNGLEATRQILAANPAAKVLMLSAHSDDGYIERATAVGAVGFLEKLTATAILTQAICEVAKGHPFFSPSIAKRRAIGKK